LPDFLLWDFITIKNKFLPSFLVIVTLVLDTSSLFALERLPSEERLFAPPGVREELREYHDTRLPFLEGMIQFLSPGSESVANVQEASRTSGDDLRLSKVDIEVLALALELDATVLTDDYSIQNLASRLGIRFRGVEKKEISQVFRWRYKCTGCGRVWDRHHRECPVCGSRLRSYRPHGR